MNDSSNIGLIDSYIIDTIDNDAWTISDLDGMCFNDKIPITLPICIETAELNNHQRCSHLPLNDKFKKIFPICWASKEFYLISNLRCFEGTK